MTYLFRQKLRRGTVRSDSLPYAPARDISIARFTASKKEDALFGGSEFYGRGALPPGSSAGSHQPPSCVSPAVVVQLQQPTDTAPADGIANPAVVEQPCGPMSRRPSLGGSASMRPADPKAPEGCFCHTVQCGAKALLIIALLAITAMLIVLYMQTGVACTQPTENSSNTNTTSTSTTTLAIPATSITE